MNKFPDPISQDTQETFESFLMHTMNETERSAFEASLKKDSKLNIQFKEFKDLFLAIEEVGLRASINGFHQEEVSTSKNNDSSVRQLPSKRLVFMVAASIIVLLGFSSIWYLNRPPVHEQLFSQHFTPDPGLPTVMSNQLNYDFYEAMVDYKQGKYASSISKWEKLLLDKANSDTLNYFIGVAHLANGNDQKAIPFLENVLKSKSFFEKEAQHYLGLAFIKQGKLEQAKPYIKKDCELFKQLSE